jgi:hypothetical protein
MNSVNLLADLEDFAHDHRPHGPIVRDATQPGILLGPQTAQLVLAEYSVSLEVTR